MRICNRCKESKPLSEFNKKDSRTGRLQGCCRECQHQYQRNFYRKNTASERSRINSNKAAIKQWFKDYKSNLKCEQCGFSHPAVIDFHHKDKNDKEDHISHMVLRCFSKSKILNEISKCTVLCSNCHRIHHYSGLV